MQGLVRTVGPQPDGPVNQNNELKVAEGSILELQTGVLLFSGVGSASNPFTLQGDSTLVSAMLLTGD